MLLEIPTKKSDFLIEIEEEIFIQENLTTQTITITETLQTLVVLIVDHKFQEVLIKYQEVPIIRHQDQLGEVEISAQVHQVGVHLVHLNQALQAQELEEVLTDGHQVNF